MKNPATAAVLGFFFGPLGLLYIAPLYAGIAMLASAALWYAGGMAFVGLANVPCAIAGYLLASQGNDATVPAQNAPRDSRK